MSLVHIGEHAFRQPVHKDGHTWSLAAIVTVDDPAWAQGPESYRVEATFVRIDGAPVRPAVLLGQNARLFSDATLEWVLTHEDGHFVHGHVSILPPDMTEEQRQARHTLQTQERTEHILRGQAQPREQQADDYAADFWA